jgi:ACR3 family arsenite transporter
MVIAIVIGYYVDDVKSKFQVAEIESVSLPIAIELWVMMYPVLCKVQYELLYRNLFSRPSSDPPGSAEHLEPSSDALRSSSSSRSGQSYSKTKMTILSLVLNWVVGPALMTGLAWATLPDLPGFRTGVILVGIARCIAMVLIWNDLANGNPDYCALLVAVNSIMQIILFTPVALFYLKVVSRSHGFHVDSWVVAKSVLLFLGVPLVAGMLTRFFMILLIGRLRYDRKFLPFVGPFALIGLLYTIFVMFSIQAHHIIDNLVHVVRVAVPLLIYFTLVFFSSLALCNAMRIPYALSVTQAFTAASNNFELAIAVAVGSFGIDSEEALAATIGPLIEVPVLLLFVYLVSFLKHKWAN